MPVVAGTQYAQISDLQNLGLLPAAYANLPPSQLNGILSANSAVVDSFLNARFILPLVTWGPDIVRAVCVLSVPDIMRARGYGPSQGPDDGMRKDAEEVRAWLREVSKEDGPTPLNIADSSMDGQGQQPPSPVDGSTVYATEGGFQGQTSGVRGWTSRGNGNFTGSNGFWDGTGDL